MWHLDYKESWAPKNWCFWTVVLEKTLESPLDCKKIQPVHPKGDQSWVFIGRTDVEAETPILWQPDAKNCLIWKDPDVGKGEGEDRGWDGWMASLTGWTWVWVSSQSWWWTGKPGVLQSMGSWRVRHEWGTELNQSLNILIGINIHLKDFLGDFTMENSSANVGANGDAGSIPGLRRSPEGGNGNQLQYSCLGNPMDHGAWWVTVHGVTEELDTT